MSLKLSITILISFLIGKQNALLLALPPGEAADV